MSAVGGTHRRMPSAPALHSHDSTEKWWEYQRDVSLRTGLVTSIAKGGEVYLMERISRDRVRDLLFAQRFVPIAQEALRSLQVSFMKLG